MKQLMKNALTALAVVIGLVTTAQAMPQPIAVWDGTFGKTTQGTTLRQSDNSMTDGVLTIDTERGTVYEVGGSTLNNSTFIIKCSGLNLASANNQYLLALHQNSLGGGNGDASYNKVGVSLAANNAAVRGIWDNTCYTTEGGGFQIASPLVLGKYLAINIQTSGGVFVWEIAEDASGNRTLTKVYGDKGLKASNTNYKGFSLGGIYEKTSSTLSPATGWKVEKLAVFGSTLTEDQIKAFRFASDVASDYLSVLSLNFGANTDARKVSADTDPCAAVADSNWYNLTTQNGTDVVVGSQTVTWSCANLYQNDGKVPAYLKGYLDDGAGTPITVSGLTGARYDVYIYCNSDNSPAWSCKTINGTSYYWDDADGVAKEGTSSWGNNGGKADAVGANVLLVKGVYPNAEGKIVMGSVRSGSYRGCVAAVQLCERASAKVYTATVSADTAWSAIAWNETIPEGGFEEDAELEVTVTGSPAILFAGETIPQKVTFAGAPVLKATDAFYTDGCWEKTAAKFGKLVKDGATAPTELKAGFNGAYTLTDNALTLRAQNREVISINIGGGRDGGDGQASIAAHLVPSNETYYGLAPVKGETWNNINWRWKKSSLYEITMTGSVAAKADGTLVARPTIDLSAKAKETYNYDCNQPYLSGYLDDGLGVTVSVHGVPYTKYDVIVYSTSDTSLQLAPITVNGTRYTYINGETVVDEGDATGWGIGQCKDPKFGGNALYVKDLTGEELTISSQRMANYGPRATVCAVQVICQGEVLLKEEFSATVSESTSFGDIAWGKAFAEGQLNEATINVDDSATDEVEIAFDNADLLLGKLIVNSARDVKFTATKPLPNVGQFVATGCTAKVTYNWPVKALQMSAGGLIAYTGGAGSASSAAGIGFVTDGDLTLTGGSGVAPYYVGDTFRENTNPYTMTFTDATVYCKSWAGLAVGMGTVTIDGTTTVDAEKFILSQGTAGQTSAITIKDTASVTVTGTSDVDSNQSSIMFGHWDGQTTFTLQDDATFTAASQVLVGKTANSHTINLDGGTFAARGIKASGSASGTNALNLNGGALVLGEVGISSYGATTIAVTVNEDTTITATAATLALTQPISIAEGKTLTIVGAAGGTALTLQGNVSGAGKLVFGPNVTVVDCGAARPTIAAGILTFTDPAQYVKYTENVKDDGVMPAAWTLAEGSETPAYKLYGIDGSEKEVTGGKYAPSVSGRVAIRAYEFEGNLNNTGSDGSGALGKDNGPFYKNGTEVFALTQPYQTITWPTEFTVAIHATLPDLQNACLIAWGTLTGGGIGLTTGDPTKNEVKMVYWPNDTAYTPLATMTVPNAQTSKHLYVFTKTADTLKIYLDGSLVVNYSGAYSLGGGYQVGSVHGGIGSTNLGRLDTVYGTKTDTNACYSVINSMRIYNAVLGPNAMAELVREFPYQSPNGTFTRTLDGDQNAWVSAYAWGKVGDSDPYDEPDAKSTVNLSAAEDATVAMNLGGSVNYEAMNFSGEGTITVTAADGNAGKATCSGTAKFGANAVVSHAAMDFANTPIEIMTGKTLTIDASSVNLAAYFKSAAITLTGLVTAENVEDQLNCTLPLPVAHRTAAFAKNVANNTYELQITVDEVRPFVYTVADGWTWAEQAVDEATVDANPDVSIHKNGEGELVKAMTAGRDYVVNGGTLKADGTAGVRATVTVNAGATFDVNGLGGSVYAVILNGGKLANDGATIGDASQTRTLTLGADSTVGGTGNLSIQGPSYGPTTIELGAFTLTKTDTNAFALVNTTVNGTGTLAVEDGILNSTENTTFTNGTLQVGAGGTVKNRSGKTLTIANVLGAGGLLQNEGTVSAFVLTGSLKLAGAGTYDTITLADGATLDVGQKRMASVAGTGTVDVALTDAEFGGALPATVFSAAEGASVTMGKITHNGADVTAQCEIVGGQITRIKAPTLFWVK